MIISWKSFGLGFDGSSPGNRVMSLLFQGCLGTPQFAALVCHQSAHWFNKTPVMVWLDLFNHYLNQTAFSYYAYYRCICTCVVSHMMCGYSFVLCEKLTPVSTISWCDSVRILFSCSIHE
jgi:hypothetical protein